MKKKKMTHHNTDFVKKKKKENENRVSRYTINIEKVLNTYVEPV